VTLNALTGSAAGADEDSEGTSLVASPAASPASTATLQPSPSPPPGPTTSPVSPGSDTASSSGGGDRFVKRQELHFPYDVENASKRFLSREVKSLRKPNA
jgi:hypothetical protein